MMFISGLGLLSAQLALMLVKGEICKNPDGKSETCKKPHEWCMWERVTCQRWELSHTRKSIISSTIESDMDSCRNKCGNDTNCREYVYNNTNLVNENCKLLNTPCRFGIEEDLTSTIGGKKLGNGVCGYQDSLAIEWCRWGLIGCQYDDPVTKSITSRYVANEEMCKRNCAYEKACVQYEYLVWNNYNGPMWCTLMSGRCNRVLRVKSGTSIGYRKMKGDTCNNPDEWCTWERVTCRFGDYQNKLKLVMSSTHAFNIDSCRNKCDYDKDCREYVYNNTDIRNKLNENCKLLNTHCELGIEEERTSTLGRKKMKGDTCNNPDEWCRLAYKQCVFNDIYELVIRNIYVTDEEMCKTNCAYLESCEQYQYILWKTSRHYCFLMSGRCTSGLKNKVNAHISYKKNLLDEECG